MKLPAIQFYPGDWHKDQGVQSLSLMERGAWFELLLMMHDSEERGVLLVNGLPIPDEVIARRLGLDNQTTNQILTTLLTYGVASRRQSDGALFCRRMVRDEKLREVRTAAGKKGGNPSLVKQKSKQKSTTGDKQIPTPSITSSTSMLSDDSMPRAGEPPAADEVEELVSPTSTPASQQPARRLAQPDPDAETFTPDTWPGLNDATRFAAICQNLGYGQVDCETYRLQIGTSLRESGKTLPASSLRNFIQSWLNNDKRQNRLLLAPEAGQTPAERPSNHVGAAPFVTPPGSGIPNLSDILKPNWQPVTAQA